MSVVFLLLLFLEPTPPATWARLIESRIHRDSGLLDTAFWQAERQTGLAMQEYLLTLGQNGDPAALDRIRTYFTDPILQGSAVFAYGEVDGAPIEPLLAAQTQMRPENMPLLAEALAKLASPTDGEGLAQIWAGWHQDLKNWALFSFWRLGNERLTQWVREESAQRLTEDDTGYVYYLYRSRTQIQAALLIKLLEFFSKQPQPLIYATRIRATQPTPELASALAGLCKAPDWRVRVNALNALAATGQEMLIEKEGRALLRDPNPNVVRTAIAALVALKKDPMDKELAYSPDSFSPSQLQTLMARAEGSRSKTFFRLVRTWEKSEEMWQRTKFIQFLGKTDDPKHETYLLGLLKGRRWEQGTPGEKVLALQALIQRGGAFLPELLAEVLRGGDSYLMAVAMDVLSQKGEGPAILSPDELERLASKLYVSADFHNSFLAGYSKMVPEERWRTTLEKLRGHPDYLARLKALQATGHPSMEMRHQIFEKPWSHQIDPKITDLATRMIVGKRSWIWRLDTGKGPVTIKLQASYAPITCANIVQLTRQDYFDRVALHRVVPNFVVQAGDRRGDGNGGPGYTIPCEINTLRYRRGSVGMAHAGKDTGGGQFFVCHSAQPHLDGGYTLFGHVIEGMTTVDVLEEGDLILDARVTEIMEENTLPKNEK